MNWWLLPVIIVFLIVLYTISEKAKTYLLMQMVKNQILKDVGVAEDLIIQSYNLLYSFVIIPILFMAVSLLMGTPYEYSFLYSVIFYASTFILL
jgi:hypothetical protein